MANKVFKKVISGVLATASAFACVAMFSGCETNYPKVQMEIEFNGKSYTLNYDLNRKVAPATVAHFLHLAGNGYYDGLCVHDYDDGDAMYTGGYNYVDDKLSYVEYYTEMLKDKYKEDFPHTVWVDEAQTAPMYTLYGEFPNNNFNVTNGRKKETFGSLTMYYTDKGSITDEVYAKNPLEKEGNMREYADNSATSLFYISLSTSNSSNSGYCTFAELSEKSVDVLKNLQTAIEDFIESEYAGEEDAFVTETKVDVDKDDAYVGEAEKEATYDVPNEPIIIKKVTVKKY